MKPRRAACEKEYTMNKVLDKTAWFCSVDTATPYIKVVGGGGTGKSCGLLERARFLMSQGEPAHHVLLLCSTQGAAKAMRSRAAAFPELRNVEITTVAQYAIYVLNSDSAKQCTQRVARMLANFEYAILMEDMKVCGLKPKRLREMLKYFYKELSELGDEKESFIQNSEESDVFQTLQENLRLRKGMLYEELSNVAYKFMRDYPEQACSFTRPFVLVDDFQNLNRASQLFVEKLSSKSLVVTGCSNEQVVSMEPYPSLQGFLSFDITHKGTKVIYLFQALRCPARINAVANSLVVQGGLNQKELVSIAGDHIVDGNHEIAGSQGVDNNQTSVGNQTAFANSKGDIRFVEWTYPNDEFMGIVRYIKHCLHDASRPVRAQDIFVAVPNKIWGKAIAKVLTANGIKADQVTSNHALQGDPRVKEKCLDLQAYTRLNLAACPEDVVAWRSWCGFGDFLTNSNHWFRLEKYAQQAGIGILEALERASLLTEGELFNGANILVKRYQEGRAFIQRASSKQGFALLNDCSPVQGEVPPAAFMSLVEPVSGCETALELLQRANERMELCFGETNAVRVGLLQMSCGMEFDTVIITGAVEGFYPAYETIGTELDDERIHELRLQERRLWYVAITKAHHTLICSTIQKDESNTAASLGMYAHRIRMENGKSLAILAPTPYLDEFGSEAPCMESSL